MWVKLMVDQWPNSHIIVWEYVPSALVKSTKHPIINSIQQEWGGDGAAYYNFGAKAGGK